MTIIERLLVVGVAVLWGFNFVVMTWGMVDMTAVSMTIWRFAFACIPLVFFVGRPAVPMKIVALYGVLFGGGVWGLAAIAMQMGASVGMTSVMMQLNVFYGLVVAFLIYREPLDRAKKIAIAFITVGYGLIMFVGDGELPLGAGFILLIAPLIWTGCNMILRTYKPDNIMRFMVWSSLFVPIPVALLSMVYQYLSFETIIIHQIISIPSPTEWVCVLFLGYIITILSYMIWNGAIVKHGLSSVAPYSLLVPVSGLFFGWLIYDEPMTVLKTVSSALIIIGLSIQFAPNMYVKLIERLRHR